MKKIIFLLIIILSFVYLSYAETLKIVVAPLEDKTGQYTDLAKELSNLVIKEVKKNGYEVIPEYTFFANWWKSATRAWNTDKPLPTLEEYEAEKKTKGVSIKELFNHDMLAMIIEHQDAWRVKDWGVDLGITGEIRMQDKKIELYLEIISFKTGRFYFSVTQLQPQQAKNIIKNETKSLLRKINLIQVVPVDEELDIAYSKVVYNVKTRTGEIIKIQVDYTSDRPNPPIQNVDILPPCELKDGLDSYRLGTKENKDLIFDFNFKNNKLESVQVACASPPDTTNIEYQETLTVTSNAGYEIKFVFSWKNNEIVSIRCEPSLNPYSCEQVGKG